MKGDRCTHHWLIDPPKGPLSEGRCKLCGDKRLFRNGYDRREENERRRKTRGDSQRRKCYVCLKPMGSRTINYDETTRSGRGFRHDRCKRIEICPNQPCRHYYKECAR